MLMSERGLILSIYGHNCNLTSARFIFPTSSIRVLHNIIKRMIFCEKFIITGSDSVNASIMNLIFAMNV